MADRFFRLLPRIAPALFIVWVLLLALTIARVTPVVIFNFVTGLAIITATAYLVRWSAERQVTQRLRDNQMATAPPLDAVPCVNTIEMLGDVDITKIETVRWRIAKKPCVSAGRIFASATAPIRQQIIEDWTSTQATVTYGLSQDEAAIVYELGKAEERSKHDPLWG